MRTEPIDQLLVAHQEIAFARSHRDDFLAHQRPAQSLDHVELRIDFIGAVEVGVQPFDLVQ